MLAREREALRRRTDALQMTLMQSQGQGAVGRESSPQAILQKVGQHAALLFHPASQACWQWTVDCSRGLPSLAMPPCAWYALPAPALTKLCPPAATAAAAGGPGCAHCLRWVAAGGGGRGPSERGGEPAAG